MTEVTIGADAVRQRSFQEVWVVSIGHALTHWYPATFYLLLPLIGAELGLSYGQIGSILACQFAAGAISNIPGGIFVDAVGRKGLLMALSLFWVGFPYLVMGFSHVYWMMLLCATLVGIGNNLWHPTAIPWLANRFPDRKGLVMAFHSMGGNVGDAIAPLVIGALLATYSWRGVVLINVIPGIIMSVMILFYIGRIYSADARAGGAEAKPAAMSGGERFRSLVALMRNPALVTLSVSSTFRAMTQSALLTFLPVYLARDMGYSAFLIGACLFALQASGFIAAPIAGHLSDKIGRRQIIMSSMSMTAVVILFMAFAGGTIWFVVLIALLGFFLFAVRAVLQAWLLDATPANMGGSAIGLLFGMQAIGQALGPVTAGIIADHYGIMAAFYFLAGTIILANLMIFVTPASLIKRP
ncbi:MAG: MFS transporter [Rhizobiales bacterium]|jgi:MFS family permease|nr:MFS transporter [Hyphomicrobiales bacterium]